MKKLLSLLLTISGLLVSFCTYSQNVDSLLLIGDFSASARLTDSTYSASVNFIDNQFRSIWLPADIKNGYDVIDAKGDWYTVVSISNTFGARTDMVLKEVYAATEIPVGRVQISGPLPTDLLPIGPVNERGINSIMAARILSYNFARLLQFIDETKAGYALTRDPQDSLEVDTTIIPDKDFLANEIAKILPNYTFDGISDVITITNSLGTTNLTIKSDFPTMILDGRFLEITIDDTTRRLDLQPLLFELDSLVAGDSLVGLAPIQTGSNPSLDYYLFKDTDSGADSLRVQAPFGNQGHKPLAYIMDIDSLQDTIAAHLILINNNATNITELFDTTFTIRSDLSDLDNLVSTLRDSIQILDDRIDSLPAINSVIDFYVLGDSIWTLITTDTTFKDTVPFYNKQAIYDSLASHLNLINTNITNITENGDSITQHRVDINILYDTTQQHRIDLDSLYGQVDSIINEITTFESTVTNADSVTGVNTIQDSIYVVYTADGNTHLDTIHFTKYINRIYDSLSVHWTQISINTVAISNLEDSISQFRTEINTIGDTLTELRTDINTNIDSLIAHRNDINSNIDSLIEHRIDINANYDSVSVLRLEIIEIYDSLSVHRIEINTIYDSLIVHRTDINKNIDSLVQHRIEINQILDSLIELRIDINQNYDSLFVHRTDINNNTDSLLQHRTEINSLFDSVLVHRGDIDDNVDSLVAHRIELNNLIDSVNGHRLLIDSLFSLLAEVSYPVADSTTDFYITNDSTLTIETHDGNVFTTTVGFTVYINALLDSVSNHWTYISGHIDSIADHRILLDSLLARDNIENAYTTNNYLYIQTRDSLYELDVYRDGFQVLDTTITDSWSPSAAYLNTFDLVKVHSITSNNQDVTLTLPQASTTEGLPIIYTSYATSGYRNFIVSNQDMVIDHEPDGQIATNPGEYSMEDKVVLNDSLLTETYTMYEVRSHETNGAQIRWWITNNNRKVSSNISYKFNEQTTVEGALDSLFNRVDNDNQVASEVPYTNNSQTNVEGALDSLFNRDVELDAASDQNAIDIANNDIDIAEINDTLASRREELNSIDSTLQAHFDSLGIHRTDINILFSLINNTIGGDSIIDFTINDVTREFAIYTNDGNVFKDTLNIEELQIITDSLTAHRLDINNIYDILSAEGGINEVADSTTGFITIQDSTLRITTADGNTFETTVNFTKYFNELSDSINVHRVVLTTLGDSLTAHRVDINQVINDLAALNSNSVIDVFDEIQFHNIVTTDSTYKISRYSILDTTITANWSISTALFNKYDEIRLHAFTIGDQITITLPAISSVNKTLVYITANPATGNSDPVVLNGVNNILMGHRPYNLTVEPDIIMAHTNGRDSLYLVDAPHLEPYVRYELQALPYLNTSRYWFLVNPNRSSSQNVEYFRNNQKNVAQGLDSLFRRNYIKDAYRTVEYDDALHNGTFNKEDSLTIVTEQWTYTTTAGYLTLDTVITIDAGEGKVVFDMTYAFKHHDLVNIQTDFGPGSFTSDTIQILIPAADSLLTREWTYKGRKSSEDGIVLITIKEALSLTPAHFQSYVPLNNDPNDYSLPGNNDSTDYFFYGGFYPERDIDYNFNKSFLSGGDLNRLAWVLNVPYAYGPNIRFNSTDTFNIVEIVDSLQGDQVLDVYKSNDTIFIQTKDSLYTIKDSLGTFLSSLIQYTNNGQTNVEEALDSLFTRDFELSLLAESNTIINSRQDDSLAVHRVEINQLTNADNIEVLDTTIFNFSGSATYNFTHALNNYDIVNVWVTNISATPTDTVFIDIPEASNVQQGLFFNIGSFTLNDKARVVVRLLGGDEYLAFEAPMNYDYEIGSLSDSTLVSWGGTRLRLRDYEKYAFEVTNYSGGDIWYLKGETNESKNTRYNKNDSYSVESALDSLFNRPIESVDTFYRTQDSIILETLAQRFAIQDIDSFDLGNRVYFSKLLGNNITGRRGDPSRPYEDPWSAYDASQDGDIITGLTKDTFILNVGDTLGNLSKFHAIDGKVVSPYNDQSIIIHFFPGSVIKCNNTTQTGLFATEGADMWLKDVTIIGTAGNPYLELASYDYSVTPEGNNLILDNVNLDSIGNVYIATWHANAYIQGNSFLANSSSQDQYIDFRVVDNQVIEFDVSNSNFDWNYFGVYSSTNSKNNIVKINLPNNQSTDPAFYTIYDLVKTSVETSISDKSGSVWIRTDSSFIDLNYRNNASGATTATTATLDIGGDNSNFNIKVEGDFKNSSGFIAPYGENTRLKVSGRVNFLESPPSANRLIYFDGDSTNTVNFDNFYVTGVDCPILGRNNFSMNEIQKIIFTDSYIETADSNFLETSTSFSAPVNRPIEWINSTIKYIGVTEPISYFNTGSNLDYVFDNFRLNIPEFATQSEYNNRVTFINNESLEDALKVRDVTIDADSTHDLRIINLGTGVFNSVGLFQFYGGSGFNILSDGTITFRASGDVNEGYRMQNMKSIVHVHDTIAGYLVKTTEDDSLKLMVNDVYTVLDTGNLGFAGTINLLYAARHYDQINIAAMAKSGFATDTVDIIIPEMSSLLQVDKINLNAGTDSAWPVVVTVDADTGGLNTKVFSYQDLGGNFYKKGPQLSGGDSIYVGTTFTTIPGRVYEFIPYNPVPVGGTKAAWLIRDITAVETGVVSGGSGGGTPEVSYQSIDTVITFADWTPLESFFKTYDYINVAGYLGSGAGSDAQITLPAPDSSYKTQMYLQVWDETVGGDVRLITGSNIILFGGTTTNNLVLTDTVLYRVAPVRSRGGTGTQYYWRVDVLTSDHGSGGGSQTAATLPGLTDTTQVLRDSIAALKARVEVLENPNPADTIASATTVNLNVTSKEQTFVITGTTNITTLNINNAINGGTIIIIFQSNLDVTFPASVIDLAAGDGTTGLGTVTTGGFKLITLFTHDSKYYGRQ